MQPDVGHEVLWVIRVHLRRDSLTKTLCHPTSEDLAELLKTFIARIRVPIVVVSDGQRSIRKAVETALRKQCMGCVTFLST